MSSPRTDTVVISPYNDNDNHSQPSSLPASYQHQSTATTGARPPSQQGNRKKNNTKPPCNKKHMNPPRTDSSNSSGDDNTDHGSEEEPQHELTQIRHQGGGSYGQVLSHDEKPPTQISIDDAVEMLGMGAFQYRVLFAAGLCFAADSMEILLLSFLAVVLKAVWNLSDEQTATITSSVFIGALIGTIVLGYLGDRIGRKPVFTLTAGIICLSGFLTAVANNFWTLLAFRFMVGFGVGGLVIPFDTLAEFVPNSHRGSNLLLIEYFWTAGTLLVPVLAFFSFGDKEGEEEEDWRIFVVLCAVPCFVSCVFSILWVPESPRWLLTQGQHQEALFVLRRAARLNGKDPDELFPLDNTIITNEEEESENFMDLFQPKWRKTIFMLWTTWAGFAFAYYGTIIAVTLVFSTEDDTHQGGEGVFDFDYGAIFASASAEVAGTTAVLLTIDKLGRVPSQVVSYACGGIAVFAMCMGASSENATREFLICMGFLARMFFMSASCTTWVSTAEILTTEVRTTGHSSANAIARLFGACSPFVVSASTPFPVIGTILLCFGLLNAFTSYNLPETMGRGMGMSAGEKPNKTEQELPVPASTTYGIV